ncbi:MAG: hypothetical protein R2880_07910 [Deinococcales bacterium]
MKIMLLFPPNWTPSMPHLALPTLSAYLRAKGVKVIQRDLNLEVFDRILTRDYLLKSFKRLQELYGKKADRPPKDRILPPREKVLWAFQEAENLARDVEGAKAVIRSEAFFEGGRGKRAFEVVMGARACLPPLLPRQPKPAKLHRRRSRR